MVVKVNVDQKKLSYTNVQACENVKVLKTCGYLLCILNQRIPCRTYLNQSFVIEPVVLTLNFVPSHRLNHYQFYEFLSELKGEYPDCPITQQFDKLAMIKLNIIY